MVRPRRQYNLSTLMAVVLAMGLNFAWIPWPGSVFLGVVIVIPLFTPRCTLIELVVFFGMVAVLGTAMMPGVAIVHKPRKPASAIAAPPPLITPQGASNVAPPSSEGPEEPNG